MRTSRLLPVLLGAGAVGAAAVGLAVWLAVAEMLAEEQKPEAGAPGLHLRLALAAVDARDPAEAVHQMNHFLETAKGARRERGRAVVAQLRANDLHGAGHGIADLLGPERD